MAVETAEPTELMETLDLRRVARVLPFGGQVPVPYGGGYEAPEAYDTHDGYGTHDTYAPNAPYSTHDPYSASSAGPDAYALEPGPTPAPIPT
ncbi:hypothetical protein GT042_31995, partial [Streptomyces sp. SID3212]|nr:hypothetical protein [Streptomyces sp. SID3212]